MITKQEVLEKLNKANSPSWTADVVEDALIAAKAYIGSIGQVEPIVSKGDSSADVLLAGIGLSLHGLEYAAYNLCDGKTYKDLDKHLSESTCSKDTLLIEIRRLKELVSK